MLNNLQIFLPILTPQAPISHFMTSGRSEFIKTIQKNNKITCIFFLLVLGWGGGGQDKPAGTAYPLGMKIIRKGARYPGISLGEGG